MTDLRCPLCEVLLAAPPRAAGPPPDMDVLEAHFEDCPAIRVPRAVARTPDPRRDKPHDGQRDG